MHPEHDRGRMVQAWHIRKATPKDADALGTCMKSAYIQYQDRMEGADLPPLNVDYASEIRDYPTWVVEAEGTIRGGLIMSFESDRASIANIAVDPKWQGQGIGGALLELAESVARERDLAELHLATHLLLHENIAMYRHLNWVETGRDETRVCMKKRI